MLLDAAGNVRDQKVLELLPKGTMLRGVFQKDAYGIDEYKGYAVLLEEVGLNGTFIRDAQVSRDNLTGQPVVNFLLTSEGGEIFYKLTSANVGKVLAVVLDNKIKAQATIRTSIRDSVQVEGFERRGGRATSPSCCAPARCPCRSRSSASRPSAPPSARTPSGRASTRACSGSAS